MSITVMTQEQMWERTQRENLETFYSQKWYISYSALKLLMWHPPAFKEKYIDRLETEDPVGKHLIDGRVIHCKLFNPQDFDDNFIVSSMDLPKDKPKELVDKVFSRIFAVQKLEDAEDITFLDLRNTILEVAKEMNYYQNLKDDKPTKKKPEIVTGDTKRLAKLLTEENINYFNSLKIKGGKDVIDQKQLDYCVKAVEIIKKSEEIMKITGMYEDFDMEVYNEKMLTADFEDYVFKDFGLKGILDNHTIWHKQGLIIINDFKTTSKMLKDFPEAVDFWDYDLQAAIYKRLVEANYKYLIDKGYTVVFNFIVCDQKHQVYIFRVSRETLVKYDEKLVEYLSKALYHYRERSFGLPYEFSKGLVVL